MTVIGGGEPRGRVGAITTGSCSLELRELGRTSITVGLEPPGP